jgi:hypothetical protein
MLTLSTLAVALVHTSSLAHFHHFYFYAPPPPPPAVWVAPDARPEPWVDARQRPASVTLSLGALTSTDDLSDEPTTALAYNARLALHLVDGLMLTGEWAGAATGREPHTAAMPLGTATVGLQWYPISFLYLRGAAGAAFVGHDSPYEGSYPAAVAAAGLDIPVSPHAAINLEAAGTAARMCCTNWNAITFSLGMTFF